MSISSNSKSKKAFTWISAAYEARRGVVLPPYPPQFLALGEGHPPLVVAASDGAFDRHFSSHFPNVTTAEQGYSSDSPARCSASSISDREVTRPSRMIAVPGSPTQGETHRVEVAGNSPVYSHGCKLPQPVADGVAGKPGCRTSGRILYISYSSRGCSGMTLNGYARVSVREPEDKNLDLQVERLVRAGCAMGNIRAEEASGAKDDRGGLLELLDLVALGDTLVVTHIDRLSRGLTFGLQVIEGLHHSGVEFRSLAEDFDTVTANGKLQLQMVLAFSEWWRNSIRERSVAGQAKARTEGRFPGRRPSLTEQQREYIR